MDRTTPIKTIDNSQMDNTAKQTPITSGIIQHGQKRNISTNFDWDSGAREKLDNDENQRNLCQCFE